MIRIQQPSDAQVHPHPGSRQRQKILFPIMDIDSLPRRNPCFGHSCSSIGNMTRHMIGPLNITPQPTNNTKKQHMPVGPVADRSITQNLHPLSIHGQSVTRNSNQYFRKPSGTGDEEPKTIMKTICLEGCRYDVVRKIALELGFREVPENEYWNILWTDTPISLDKALDMRRLQDAHKMFWGPILNVQKTNHFPGMHEICRKDRLARNLNRMKKIFRDDYNFFPKTWILPADVSGLVKHHHRRCGRNPTYICKPDFGCQGKGIFLVQNLKKINPFAKLISQVYIQNPLLIDGYKFDLRIYILITSCDPLRVYVYNEGIARFATVKYCPPNDKNADVVFMHLTNYSLNKFSQSYMPEPEGSKRKLTTVYGYLVERGFNVEKMIENIDDLIIKTVIAAQPTLRHYYRASFPNPEKGSSCFEILGFDILIDEKLKPWLLEVNLSPSFNLDLAVDAEIKETLLRDTLKKIYLGTVRDKPYPDAPPPPRKGVVNLAPPGSKECADKTGNQIPRMLQKQFYHEQLNQGNFRLVYPTENWSRYAKFLDPNVNVASSTIDVSTPCRRCWWVERYLDETDEQDDAQVNSRPMTAEFIDFHANISDASGNTPNSKHVKQQKKKRGIKHI